jgi:LPXTG-motif cell wall-anchored protein
MSLRSAISRLLPAIALAVAIAAPASASNHATVRVLHASPDAPAVDIYLDDAAVSALTNVPFATLSDYLDVPSGDHNVKVYATGTTTDPVIDVDVTLAAGTAYTIAATDAVAAITPQVLVDDPAPDCDTAQVRVVHFSADAPAVDIAPAGATPDEAVIKNLAYPDASDYVALPGGTYDLEVRPAGETTVALDLPGVAVEDCMAYSVFAIGSAADPAVGDNGLQVVVAVDASANPDMPETDTLPATGSNGVPPLVLIGVAMLAFALSLRVLRTRVVAAGEPRD